MKLGKEDGKARQERPRLAPGCDPTGLALSPEEAFLITRIDGNTPWNILREMGNMPPEQVDELLQKWSQTGVIDFGEGSQAASAPPPPRVEEDSSNLEEPEPEPDAITESTTQLKKVDKSLLDPSLDLTEEKQMWILQFEANLDRSYYEILGLKKGATDDEIKDAYFRLSKDFHPDRYFRKNIGDFSARLQTIFMKVVEAYEVMSDPVARREIELSFSESGKSGGSALRKGPKTFGVMSRLIGKRRAKAKTLFESGMSAYHEERWMDAVSGVRLAVAFDPFNDQFKQKLAEVGKKASEVLGEQLLKRARSAMEVGDRQEALDLYGKALRHLPLDSDANHRAAKLTWQLGGDLKQAKEYAGRACELEPENTEWICLLGHIYRDAGLGANAKREFKRALEMDPGNAEAKAGLRALS